MNKGILFSCTLGFLGTLAMIVWVSEGVLCILGFLGTLTVIVWVSFAVYWWKNRKRFE